MCTGTWDRDTGLMIVIDLNLQLAAPSPRCGKVSFFGLSERMWFAMVFGG